MRIRAIGVWIYVGFVSSCFAGQSWYPKASDQCAKYVTNTTTRSAGTLTTPTRDPVIKKLVEDFNAATGVKDKGGMALLSLLGYCNTHASTKLGEISARELVAMMKGSAYQDQLEQWYNQSLAACGSKSQCVGIIASYRNHVTACNAGDKQACADMERDLKVLNQYNSTVAGTSAAPAPQQSQADALQTCLQNTAKAAAQYCSSHNQCDGAVVETVKLMQESQCGYSAIKLPEPTSTSHCTTSPTYGGGWTTDCTQQ